MTAGRGRRGKISPEELVDEFWRAFEGDRKTITKILALINCFLPKLAEKIMRKGLSLG